MKKKWQAIRMRSKNEQKEGRLEGAGGGGGEGKKVITKILESTDKKALSEGWNACGKYEYDCHQHCHQHCMECCHCE